MLAAAGIGAILAPPVMGAAAFLIAEFLNISYFDIVMMAIIPAVLYYLSIFLMVEADSRRSAASRSTPDLPTLGAVTRAGWHHFASLVAIVVLMVRGMTAFRAVFWATVLAVRRQLPATARRRCGRAGSPRRSPPAGAASCRSSRRPRPPASSSASSR